MVFLHLLFLKIEGRNFIYLFFYIFQFSSQNDILLKISPDVIKFDLNDTVNLFFCFLFFIFIIVVQVQLSPFSPSHGPLPHPSQPPILKPTPFGFVHVSVLIPVPGCFDYSGLVIQFDIRYCDPSCFVLLSQNYCSYSGLFMVPI